MLMAANTQTAERFRRAIIMPNLKPPVVNTKQALAYRERIMAALASTSAASSSFNPMMTLYLTDSTPPDEIKKAKASGKVFACKLYPAGATTNSDSGKWCMSGRACELWRMMYYCPPYYTRECLYPHARI